MIRTILESAADATNAFHTFDDGKPDLIRTGLGPVDAKIGGLFAGSAGILAASQGVGKSSTMLLAAVNAQEQYPVGIISLEDTPDVLGSRALSLVSGVDSLRIRTKQVNGTEMEMLRNAMDTLSNIRICVSYCVGAPLQEIQDEVMRLGEMGCKLIYIDYIQKIRGGTGERRNEVAGAFSSLQGTCSKAGCAAMFISQFRRAPVGRDGKEEKIPQTSWLKESGDLENEARLIILMYRDELGILHARIAKSSFGGEGVIFRMARGSDGALREVIGDGYP